MDLSGISLGRSVYPHRDVRQRHSLGKGHQHKLPLGNADVRDFETLVIHLDILIQQDIQINVARPLVNNFLAAQGPLNVLQSIK